MGTSMQVILPEQCDCSKVRTVYLLHGLSDNCTGWTRYTSVERYARAYQVAVVMPEVQRSYYTDMACGLPYFTFISEELPRLCSNMFGLPAEGSYMMGLSMGGYGAMKCVLTHPSRYSGCASFSAVMDIKGSVRKREGRRKAEFRAIFGEKVPDEDDLHILLERANAADLPRFLITCGEQDEHLQENRRMAALLDAKPADCVFQSWEGGHEWAFWDESVHRAFDYFFA